MNTSELQRIKQRYNIVGNSPGLNRALDVALQVAPTDLSVLIVGEKLIYLINDSQPRADGNMLLAAPAVLILDELDGNLRYVMMLELSQME